MCKNEDNKDEIMELLLNNLPNIAGSLNELLKKLIDLKSGSKVELGDIKDVIYKSMTILDGIGRTLNSFSKAKESAFNPYMDECLNLIKLIHEGLSEILNDIVPQIKNIPSFEFGEGFSAGVSKLYDATQKLLVFVDKLTQDD